MLVLLACSASRACVLCLVLQAKPRVVVCVWIRAQTTATAVLAARSVRGDGSVLRVHVNAPQGKRTVEGTVLI